jgi:SAM-dependent methyltransferase
MEAATGLPSAVGRALALLEPALRDAEPTIHDGYLDLVGQRSPRSTGPAQDLMLTGMVPAIYERWWRPALGRLAKGVFGPGMAEEQRIARLLLGLGRGDGVLDVACGPGNFTREFARAVGPVGLAVGIDASPTMLARAVRDTGAPNVAYVRGDAVALPFRDRSFDAVCCFAALHLFADPMRALDRMTAVLTPGGRIAIFTSVRGRSAPLRTFESIAGRRSGMRMFERDEVVAALEARGYAEIRQRVTGLTQFVGGRLAD